MSDDDLVAKLCEAGNACAEWAAQIRAGTLDFSCLRTLEPQLVRVGETVHSAASQMSSMENIIDDQREQLRDGSPKERYPTVWAYEKACAVLTRKNAQLAELRFSVEDALASLYNPLEPDNQSAAYKRLKDAIAKSALSAES